MSANPCYRHAAKVASVVCARCDRPICTECMIQAPVGWQCPECVRQGAKKSRVSRPLANRNPGHRSAVGSTNPTPVVIGLIVLNVVTFVATGLGRSSRVDRFALQPINIHYFHQYYRLFTAMFLHANLLHIAGNMIALLMVGPAVEAMLGRGRFLALYLIGGLGGSVCSYLLGQANEFGVGASGAIFGVMGAYVVLARRRRVPMGPVVALIAINLVIGFTGHIDYRAHIGGLITAALVALVYDVATNLRHRAQGLALTVGFSVVVLVMLALLVVGITPGHVNLA
jgi:membrane associated rhomboid family serine protease